MSDRRCHRSRASRRSVVIAVASLSLSVGTGCGTDVTRSDLPTVPAPSPVAASTPESGGAPSPAPASPTVAASAPSPSPPGPAVPERVTVELGPWQGEMAPLIAQHVARAKTQGLVPFVEFYADWCPPCKALKRYWDDPRMSAAMKGTYIIVLNVDDWQDKLKGTGFVPRIIPVFYAVDDKGKPTGRKITGDDWGKNKDVPDRMAPALERFFAAR